MVGVSLPETVVFRSNRVVLLLGERETWADAPTKFFTMPAVVLVNYC